MECVFEHFEIRIAHLLRQPPLSIDHCLRPFLARRLGIDADAILDYHIERRSIDARRRGDPRLVYRLRIQLDSNVALPASLSPAATAAASLQLEQVPLSAERPRQVIVVGGGPAGLMAAYLLSHHGCEVLLLDRGRDVVTREQDIAAFLASRELNPESNYLYGEGGAGTYSDGKLYTRVKDVRLRFLLQALVQARAPRRIFYDQHPHIGSDLLPWVLRNLRAQIQDWGGVFRWQARVTEVLQAQGRCRGVRLANGESLYADAVLIAPGHSARDLLYALIEQGIAFSAKGYQLGCRIEHPQDLIDRGRYGRSLPGWLGGAADYHLVSRPHQSSLASVSTFCMCPGGEIIAATSEPGRLCTNGMSTHARASGWANAALIVNQAVDRSQDPRAAVDEAFCRLRALESQAFALAEGAAYACPAQPCTAFLQSQASSALRASSYRLGLVPGRLDRLLPADTVAALAAALQFFDRQIPGFISQGQLIGVETRVSSPLRFLRDPQTHSSSLPGLYLAGEGAGYAGGIISAGLDGLRLAEAILTQCTAKRS